MTASVRNVAAAPRRAGLSGRPVCVHCSLRSFGRLEGGARTIIDAFLAEGSTVLVPSFSWSYATPPPASDRPRQNGTRYEGPVRTATGGPIFDPTSTVVDRDMGAVSAAVVSAPGRVRGYHPICSFAAVGPDAARLVETQAPGDVWAPLEQLVELGGAVVLMGVDPTRLPLAHLAETRAGRRPFVRWALNEKAEVIRVQVGSCSDGFASFENILEGVGSEWVVGESKWAVLPAEQTLDALTRAIVETPEITRCENPECDRCRDALAGGPLD